MITLDFILANATVVNVQDAVKRFDVSGLPYTFRQSILNEFPEYRGCGLQLGIDISTVMAPFKADWSQLQEIDRKIRTIQTKLRLIGKWHTDYLPLCIEHDALVLLNNELNKPINDFLKLYKKAQKKANNKISVRKKSEPQFQQPA
jgi:hypothetical protein